MSLENKAGLGGTGSENDTNGLKKNISRLGKSHFDIGSPEWLACKEIPDGNIFKTAVQTVRAVKAAQTLQCRDINSASIFYPRTAHDFNWIIEQIALGKTNAEVFKLMRDPAWRTELIEFRGELFCATCDALISPEWCPECGEGNWRKAVGR